MKLKDYIKSLTTISSLSISFHLLDSSLPWVLSPDFYHHSHPKCRKTKMKNREQCMLIDSSYTRKRLKESPIGFVKTCHGNITEYVQPIRFGGSVIAVCFIMSPPQYIEELEVMGEIIENIYLEELSYLKENTQGSHEMNILKWIAINFKKPNCSLKKLAGELRLSESRTSQIICKTMESNFPELLKKRRILHARNLLEVSDIPIRQVSEESGFNETGYFFRLFKQETGMTPLQYRKRIRSAKDRQL